MCNLGSIRRSIRLSRDIGGKGCTNILNIGVSLVLNVAGRNRLEIQRKHLYFQFQWKMPLIGLLLMCWGLSHLLIKATSTFSFSVITLLDGVTHFPVPSVEATVISRLLVDEVIARHGAPSAPLVSDRGKISCLKWWQMFFKFTK